MCVITYTNDQDVLCVFMLVLLFMLKALPRVYGKYSTRGRVKRYVNTAQGEAKCCIYLETPLSAVFPVQTS